MKLNKWLWLFSLLIVPFGGLHAAQEITAVETKIKTLTLDPSSQSPVVVLETVTDKKLLPIWIDVPEARAIALELEHVAVPRPLTHDLIRNILQKLGATLHRVTITDLRNNTYFAVLSLGFKGQELEIDSRPSDAIAVALRMKAPIYASTQVLAKAKSLPLPSGRGTQAQKTLGLQAQDLTAELATLLDIQVQRGVLVADVASGSLAMSAGIQPGDVITKANDQAIESAKDLEGFLEATRPPARIKLEVIKKGKPIVVAIDLPS
jgi:bifunctional DNase/RNase